MAGAGSSAAPSTTSPAPALATGLIGTDRLGDW